MSARAASRRADEPERLPYSPEVERSVLGAILLAPTAIDDVTSIQAEGDFYNEAHRQIYRAVIALSQREGAIDLVTVRDELSRNGGLEKAGGSSYLAALIDGIPDIGNVEHYARIVKEKSTLRGLIQVGQKLIQEALSEEMDATTLLARATAEIQIMKSQGCASDGWLSPPSVLRDSPLRSAPRVETNFTTLDDATGGGLPIGSVVVLSGAPGSGKTTLAIQTARAAREQLGARAVGFFGDEGLEAATVRLGQQIKLPREGLEAAEETLLADLSAYVAGDEQRGPFEFVSPREPLKTTLAKLHALRRRGETRPFVFVLDNLQGCNFELEDRNGSGQQSPERLRLAAAMVELRKAARELAMLVLVVSEASRGAYASKDPEKRTTALAAGAETRAIEYRSDVVLHLSERSESVIECEVAKNRPGGGQKPRLRLGHDRERACYAEIDRPAADEEREQKKDRARQARTNSAQEKILPAFRKRWRAKVKAAAPGIEPKPIAKTQLAEDAGLNKGRQDFRDGMAALVDGQKVFEAVEIGDRTFYRPGVNYRDQESGTN